MLQDFETTLNNPEAYEDYDFDMGEEDIQDLEDFSLAMDRGLGIENSSDENSQNENNKHGANGSGSWKTSLFCQAPYPKAQKRRLQCGTTKIDQ